MLVQGQVGIVGSGSASLAPGYNAPLRQGNMGDLIASELHGRYYEAAYRRNVYSAANQAAVATVAVGTTAYTGLSLSNPVGATVNLVLMKCSWAASVAIPTAGLLGLETGYNAVTQVTHTTPLTVYNHYYGVGSVGVGLVDGASTLPTAPVSRAILNSNGNVATTGFGIVNGGQFDLEGSIILPPGAYAAFFTSATNTAAWWFSLMWEEVPV